MTIKSAALLLWVIAGLVLSIGLTTVQGDALTADSFFSYANRTPLAP